MTFNDLIALAEAKLGSREALLRALNNLSRQRLQSALAGGPPLRSERLLSLALAAEFDPIEVLHAGGRHQLADAWKLVQGRQNEPVTISQRALLRDFEQLSAGHQGVVRQLARGLVSGVPDVSPMPRRRRKKCPRR